MAKETAQKESGQKESGQKGESVKVGRNDPCPCGSGEKYKKCCADKDEAKRSAELAAEAAKPATPEEESAAAEAKASDDSRSRHGQGFTSQRGAAPPKRPSHVRKRTV